MIAAITEVGNCSWNVQPCVSQRGVGIVLKNVNCANFRELAVQQLCSTSCGKFRFVDFQMSFLPQLPMHWLFPGASWGCQTRQSNWLESTLSLAQTRIH